METDEPLIDPSLLSGLTNEEKEEALAAAAAAKRAEERAEQRALAKAMERKRLERQHEQEREKEQMEKLRSRRMMENPDGSSDGNGNKVVFLSKKRRAEIKTSKNQVSTKSTSSNHSHCTAKWY